MRYRPLGRSGIKVSEIGFGAWGIGGKTAGETSYGETDDRHSAAALSRALELGITLFDTANVYGDGRSEHLIGEAFARKRAAVVIATKAGLEKFGAPPDFSPAALRRSLAGSLARLDTDYVDLLQLHNPPADLFTRSPETYAALEEFVREGRARAFGVSAKSPADALTILARHRLDAIQVNLNMLDTRAADSGLLERAQSTGTAIIARTPLCFGFLSGAVTAATEFPPGDHRRQWPRRQIERWAQGSGAVHAAAQTPTGQSKSQVALRFCLSFPAVASVIPGILGAVEAEENSRASDFGPLPEAAVGRILALNRGDGFFAPG